MVLSTPSDTAALTARLLRLAGQLAPLDLAVLRALAALRLMTSDQVRRLVFAHGPTHTRALRARRALHRLHALGLVLRVDRHVGGRGAGSTSYVYHLADQAQRLLGVRRTEPHAVQGARDHTLAIADLAVTLNEAHHAHALELIRFEPEPVSSRSYTANGHRHYIRPDAFTTVAAGAWERLWWIELDRGTQSPAVIRRKAHAYAAYAETGIEQDGQGVFPRVAYLTTTVDRCRALARALADTPPRRPARHRRPPRPRDPHPHPRHPTHDRPRTGEPTMTNHPNRRRPSPRCNRHRPVADRAKIARTAQLLRPWYRAYLADRHNAADDKPEPHTTNREPRRSRRRATNRCTANHRPNRRATGDKGRAGTSR